jgi:hypothetical protein
MVLRKLRWLSAAVLAAVAVFASPARSQAGTQIIVTEFDTSTNTVVNSASFTLATLPTAGSPYTPVGGNFRDISITMTSSSGSGASDFHSLTTTFGAKPTDGTFNPNVELRLSIIDDGFLSSNPNGTGILSGNVGNSSGGSVTNVTGDTTLSTGMIGGTTPLLTLGPDSAGNGSGTSFTSANIASMPGAFAIEQTLALRVSAVTSANASFGSTISTFLSTSPQSVVPAPAGLILALTAVPVIGLRRVLRKKA